MHIFKLTFGSLVFLLFFGCKNGLSEKSSNAEFANFVSNESKFDDYWYQGKAELSSYTLEQARYGEIHKGEAVYFYIRFDPVSIAKMKCPVCDMFFSDL